MSSDEEEESKITITQLEFVNTDLNTNKDNLVFHYFVDNLSQNEIQNAYIILFAGKTGSGKTTAINAFVNIVKGIKLGDPKRYKLIEEKPKAKGQSESQTDGIHLYFLKDYENNPLIIIDSQGYGDTRGHAKDLEINKAFEYVFSNIIDHINIVCLTMNARDNRLDPLTKYIYSSVTALFADDISDNFIVLATFANPFKLKDPDIIHSILQSEDGKFLQIKNESKKIWWYTFDSLKIFENDNDKLTNHSFKQLQKFYNDTVKQSVPKDIKKSAEILTERYKLLNVANKIENQCKKIIYAQDELEKEEKNLQNKKTESESLKNQEKRFYNILKNSPKEKLIKMIENKEKSIKELGNSWRNETVDAENKDLESLRKVLENIVNREKQNLEEIEKNSEQIKNCEKEIREYENKIYNIKHNLKKSQKDLLLNLAELLKINEKIKKFALNKSHAGTENDYIINLIEQINPNEIKKIQKLKKILKFNNLFMKTQNINVNDLEKLSAEELAKKIDGFFAAKGNGEK